MCIGVLKNTDYEIVNMRLNENTKIIGKRVILVPYLSKHVVKYHEWMKSPELQELTASEPLTLEEEYEMQGSWREDDDKLTFLVLCRETYSETGECDDTKALVGDANLFLRQDEEANERMAEAEIMIAEEWARGKRYGWEAVLLLLKYAQLKLNINRYEVKIGMNNEKSLKMFEKMQFKETARSEVFREVTMECAVTADWMKWLDCEVGPLNCAEYK